MEAELKESGRWAHGEATVGGVRLHYVEAGEGPLVLLLHGFPEFWYSWHHQIPALAAAGFRAVAPDMRGYNLSDKPAGLDAYRVERLVDDVAGLIAHFGEEQATVVGHDWGGLVAWYSAILRPEIVDRLVVINAPHPAAYRRELTRSTQALRSWYAGFFQLPILPEAAMRTADFMALERVLRTEPVRPGAFSDDDIRLYKEALAQPGALTSTINYYRAAARDHSALTAVAEQPIRSPTLLIWGDQDPYLVSTLADDLEPWVPDIRVERLRASHWVPVDAPEEVNRLILDFLGRARGEVPKS
jgi:epoxide hydrolase 4